MRVNVVSVLGKVCFGVLILCLGFALFCSKPSYASDLILRAEYVIPKTSKEKPEIRVLATDSGLVAVLSFQNEFRVISAKDGLPLTQDIATSTIRSLLSFGGRDGGHTLSYLGCGGEVLCASANDVDVVVKIGSIDGPGALEFEYIDFSRLKRAVRDGFKGGAKLDFTREEHELLEALVSDSGQAGVFTAELSNAVADIPSLSALRLARNNIAMFRFSSDSRLFQSRRFGGDLIEENFLSRLEQSSCRILGREVVRSFQPNVGVEWVSTAMRDGLERQCGGYSVQFRLGMLDADEERRIRFARSLKDLACSTHSSDYWCAARSLEGGTCQDTSISCGEVSGIPPTVRKPEKAEDVRQRSSKEVVSSNLIDKVVDEARLVVSTNPFAIFDFSEPSATLQRDKGGVGVSFYARLPQDAAKGRFRVEVVPNAKGVSMLRLGSYRATLSFVLAVDRLDECRRFCLFSAPDKVTSRVERLTRQVVLRASNGYRGVFDLAFGDLTPLNNLVSMKSSLKGVKLVVDKFEVSFD